MASHQQFEQTRRHPSLSSRRALVLFFCYLTEVSRSWQHCAPPFLRPAFPLFLTKVFSLHVRKQDSQHIHQHPENKSPSAFCAPNCSLVFFTTLLLLLTFWQVEQMCSLPAHTVYWLTATQCNSSQEIMWQDAETGKNITHIFTVSQ